MLGKEPYKDQKKELIPNIVTLSEKLTEKLLKRRKNRVNLFDSQMKTLEECSCSPTIIKAFQDQEDAVLDKAVKTDISAEGNIPFLPVIPRSYVDIYKLMLMIRNCEGVGNIQLDLNEIFDIVRTPSNPYFIFDVKKQRRSLLTVDQGIALCVHTDVLLDHPLDCTNSRYKHNCVLRIYLYAGIPMLSIAAGLGPRS